MNIDELREYCLAKPGVTESMPFGEGVLVYKVGGKIFALSGIDSYPLSANLKCDPERAIELRDQYADITPGYHMNKQHWNTVLLENELSNSVIRELIDHSYDLIFASLPRKQQAEIVSTDAAF